MREYGGTEVFKDTKQREIKISIEDDYPPTVIAKHRNEIIGQLKFIEYSDSILLHQAEIKDSYQYAGIATQMMKEIYELVDENLYVPHPQWCRSLGHETYVSSEGAAFINSLLENEILSDKNIAAY